FEVFLVLLREMFLAAAGVNDESERERDVDAFGKEGDLLRNVVLEDFDVVLGKVVDECAARIAGGEGYVHKIHARLERSGLLSLETRAGKTCRREEQRDHGTKPECRESTS